MYMAIGKFLRYLIITTLLLSAFPSKIPISIL
jgi:membrane protein YqaA with SNARE-associated domain